MKTIGVIPSRLGATRFPRKPLAMIAGKPMIVRVLERARLATTLDEILVATDSEEIAVVVRSAGGEVVMTDPALPSGTDRVGAAVKGRNGDFVLSIQGDEPALDPTAIDLVVRTLHSVDHPAIVTPAVPQATGEILEVPSFVKVVVTNSGNALYFSRAAIPFPRNAALGDVPPAMLHLGLYGYRRDALEWFCANPPSPLELRESLEQLRFLENGWQIRVVATDRVSFGVDTPEDVERIELLMREQGIA